MELKLAVGSARKDCCKKARCVDTVADDGTPTSTCNENSSAIGKALYHCEPFDFRSLKKTPDALVFNAAHNQLNFAGTPVNSQVTDTGVFTETAEGYYASVFLEPHPSITGISGNLFKVEVTIKIPPGEVVAVGVKVPVRAVVTLLQDAPFDATTGNPRLLTRIRASNINGSLTSYRQVRETAGTILYDFERLTDAVGASSSAAGSLAEGTIDTDFQFEGLIAGEFQTSLAGQVFANFRWTNQYINPPCSAEWPRCYEITAFDRKINYFVNSTVGSTLDGDPIVNRTLIPIIEDVTICGERRDRAAIRIEYRYVDHKLYARVHIGANRPGDNVIGGPPLPEDPSIGGFSPWLPLKNFIADVHITDDKNELVCTEPVTIRELRNCDLEEIESSCCRDKIIDGVLTSDCERSSREDCLPTGGVFGMHDCNTNGYFTVRKVSYEPTVLGLPEDWSFSSKIINLGNGDSILITVKNEENLEVLRFSLNAFAFNRRGNVTFKLRKLRGSVLQEGDFISFISQIVFSDPAEGSSVPVNENFSYVAPNDNRSFAASRDVSHGESSHYFVDGTNGDGFSAVLDGLFRVEIAFSMEVLPPPCEWRNTLLGRIRRPIIVGVGDCSPDYPYPNPQYPGAASFDSFVATSSGPSDESGF